MIGRDWKLERSRKTRKAKKPSRAHLLKALVSIAAAYSDNQILLEHAREWLAEMEGEAHMASQLTQ